MMQLFLMNLPKATISLVTRYSLLITLSSLASGITQK